MEDHPWIKEVLFSEEAIQARVLEMAQQISRDFEGKTLVVVVRRVHVLEQGELRDVDTLQGVLKGAFMFMSDLVKRLSVDHRIEFMALSSYGDGATSGSVRIIMDLRKDIEGADVLIVEDIVDTGNTLKFLQQVLQARKPASLSTCVFLNKSDNRQVNASVEYVGFEVPNKWVVGYGLDYAEKLRTLPLVAELKPEVYQ